MFFVVIPSLLAIGVASLIVVVLGRRFAPCGKKRVCIVVLGDIGRSPRMQYHALSFSRHTYAVDMIGYGGSLPHKDLQQNKLIHQHHMSEPPAFLKYFPSIMVYFLKVIWQSGVLFLSMMSIEKPKLVLVQNPPALPTLAIACLVCKLQGSCLMVDWHNYGYTILGLTLGARHPLVVFSKWYEHFFGQFSDINICVTKAMKEDLQKNWNIKAVTIYDRPPSKFKRLSVKEQHDLFMKLSKEYPIFGDSEGNEQATAITEELPDRRIRLRSDRPALIISSTSWTQDEDFSLLLKALEDYELAVGAGHSLPKIICAITGKGPQRSYYQELINENDWQHVKIITPWLAAEDYPKLLGSADFGVCLHMSSSGLDLPMKVVDMFGCGLPVCAVKYNCLHELVRDGENGVVFSFAFELGIAIRDLLEPFPKDQTQLDKYRDNIRSFQALRWDKNWDKHILPLIQ